MPDPLETAELLAFTRTVDARSVSRAALELRIPRATVSRRLARLEERLGARLVQRNTRSLALTDAGEALYRHAKTVLEALALAESSVRRPEGAIAGDLRVSVPPIVDQSFFELVVAFARRHPGVRMQVHASTRHVDLRRDGYDVALRAGAAISPGLIARTLFRSKTVAVAAPSYVSKNGSPRTAKDLRRHRCLMGFARGELPETYWRIDGRAVRIDGAFFSNDFGLLSAAAAGGVGIALLPHLFAEAGLAGGALVQVLEERDLGSGSVALVTLERRLLPPQVRAFVEAVSAWRPRRA